MKKLLHSKHLLILIVLIVLIFIVVIYIESKSKYPVAVLGSINYSDKNSSIVMLDMKKKIIMKTNIEFQMDITSEALVSYNKKYLAYTIYTEENHGNKLFIRNLENKTDKQVIPYTNESSLYILFHG